MPSAKYLLYVLVEGYGFAEIYGKASFEITVDITVTCSSRETSLFGGTNLQIYGSGFDTDDLDNNMVTVCGHRCEPTAESTYDNF